MCASVVDLLPAGPALRQAKRIVWPETGFEMSLAGFEHVFARALAIPFAEGVHYRVAPPPVIALLKIIAFMSDQHGRKKDLLDVTELFRRYDAGSDRIFSDVTFAAGLPDIEFANAFLLGIDVASLAGDDEVAILNDFLRALSISDEEQLELEPEDTRQREALRFQQQLRAFRKGIDQGRSSDPRSA